MCEDLNRWNRTETQQEVNKQTLSPFDRRQQNKCTTRPRFPDQSLTYTIQAKACGVPPVAGCSIAPKRPPTMSSHAVWTEKVVNCRNGSTFSRLCLKQQSFLLVLLSGETTQMWTDCSSSDHYGCTLSSVMESSCRLEMVDLSWLWICFSSFKDPRTRRA